MHSVARCWGSKGPSLCEWTHLCGIWPCGSRTGPNYAPARRVAPFGLRPHEAKSLMSEISHPEPPVIAFVKGPLDVYMGIVVCIHLAFMTFSRKFHALNCAILLDFGFVEESKEDGFFQTPYSAPS